MTTGQWIVVALFIGALLCSLSLYLWLRRIVRRDQHHNARTHPEEPSRRPPEAS